MAGVGCGDLWGAEREAPCSEIGRPVADRQAELAAATREISRQALHDRLTGLPNRTLCWDRLSHCMSLADRRPTGFAVLFLDLDNFKAINDTLGHAVGDRLLVDVAGRIRAQLRAGDTAARVGGDEFVVLLDEVVSAEAALTIAHRLAEVLRAPFEIGTDRLTRSAPHFQSGLVEEKPVTDRGGPGRLAKVDLDLGVRRGRSDRDS